MRRGTRVGQAYIAVTADGEGINEDIVDSVDEAGPGVERAGKDHGERYGEKFNEGWLSKIKERFNKGSLSRSLGDEGDDSGKQFTDRFENHFDNGFLDRLGARVGGHLIDGLNFAISREGGDNPLADLVDKWMEDAVSGNGKRGGGKNDKGGIGDVVGRLLGAGSRNNFLNVFGKALGGIVNISEKAASGVGKVFSTFSKGFSEMEEGASVLQRIGGGFSKVGAEGSALASRAMSALAKSGPAAAVAILVVVAALSVMVSVVGALLGLVTALASTIASALVGAVIIGAAAFSALAAAGGLLTAAFMSMTDAQKAALADAFRPLKAEMVGIGQIILEDLIPAFATWSMNLQNALMLAVPVAQVMGQAFADAGNILTAALSGPGFQMFAAALTTYLPGIVTSLSTALGSFLNGLLAVFATLMPYVAQFSTYLADVAARFSDWANSAQGQNAIVDFTDRAVESIKSLWGFITSFSDFLFSVLFSPEAMNAGNTIFDSMAEKFGEFTDMVARAQADGSLQQWFDDAIQFGSQLWSVIESLGGTFAALYDSGVLQATGDALGILAGAISALNLGLEPAVWLLGKLGTVMFAVLSPINAANSAINSIANAIDWVVAKMGNAISVGKQAFDVAASLSASAISMTSTAVAYGDAAANGHSPSMSSVQASGTSALNATSVSNGGYKPDKIKKPKQYKNPYKKWAESLMKDTNSTSAQVKNAMIALNKAALAGIKDAASAVGTQDARDSIDSVFLSLRDGAQTAVNTAQSALNSAASSLASAGSKSAAAAALNKVRQAQKDLKATLKNQKTINAAAAALAKQKVLKWDNVVRMVNGLSATNVTLAEFAAARSAVAAKIEVANQQLSDAIALRDDYKKSVTDSIKTFASLATAQAKTIDGVEQALTANDINTNLTDRLNQIKKFQNDLQLLLAQGLSDDAYKQIVDEGVVGGTAIADALLAGGNSAIQETNSLVSQINGIAGTLGTQTSDRLYAAGVSAAQGLVDGLTSLSAQLDSAATALGNSIAASIKKSLGIKSPSKVLRDMMNSVGDGAVDGLLNQQTKVGNAASVLADLIAVNPGGGPPAAGGPPVSGNGNGWTWTGDIVTPTEDPMAVANEVLNELTGRLP